MPSGALPSLNLAVCPSAACSPNSGAQVPHTTALWAACLSVSSQRKSELRQSATRPRLMAVRPSAASARFGAVASHRTHIPQSWQSHHCLAFAKVCGQLEMLQNEVGRHQQNQGGLGMSGQASISVSMPSAGSRFFASAPCLTHWSRGRLLYPALRQSQVGAPYRGR